MQISERTLESQHIVAILDKGLAMPLPAYYALF